MFKSLKDAATQLGLRTDDVASRSDVPSNPQAVPGAQPQVVSSLDGLSAVGKEVLVNDVPIPGSDQHQNRKDDQDWKHQSQRTSTGHARTATDIDRHYASEETNDFITWDDVRRTN